jgi:hypothetical protein
MLRFSFVLVAVLALIGATTVAISPASAYTGVAYDKCMAKCQKTATKASNCPHWCETNNR